MDRLSALLGPVVQFVYTCWDRIVLNGYIERLQRPENLIYFFHDVVGIACIEPTVLEQRTTAYKAWVRRIADERGILLREASTWTLGKTPVLALPARESRIALADERVHAHDEPGRGVLRLVPALTAGRYTAFPSPLTAASATIQTGRSTKGSATNTAARRRSDAIINRRRDLTGRNTLR